MCSLLTFRDDQIISIFDVEDRLNQHSREVLDAIEKSLPRMPKPSELEDLSKDEVLFLRDTVLSERAAGYQSMAEFLKHRGLSAFNLLSDNRIAARCLFHPGQLCPIGPSRRDDVFVIETAGFTGVRL